MYPATLGEPSSALSEAGIKYFSIGPNLRDRIGTSLVAWEDRPFYWHTPDGQHKVLCWVSYQGYAWSHVIKQITEDTVAAYVDHLDQIKYPYDLGLIRWSGHGDNAVPDAGLIDAVKRWNELYEWPKLKIAVVSEPFERLEQSYADKIPTVRGDWTPYWEDGAASSALETAMNRATAECLVAAETLWAMLRPARNSRQTIFAQHGVRRCSTASTPGVHCSISEPESPLTIGQWNYKRGYATADADARSRKLLSDAVAEGSPIEGAVDVFNTNSWPRTQVVTVSKPLTTAGDCVLTPRESQSRRSDWHPASWPFSPPTFRRWRRDVSSFPPTSRCAGDVKVGPISLENAIRLSGSIRAPATWRRTHR